MNVVILVAYEFLPDTVQYVVSTGSMLETIKVFLLTPNININIQLGRDLFLQKFSNC